MCTVACIPVTDTFLSGFMIYYFIWIKIFLAIECTFFFIILAFTVGVNDLESYNCWAQFIFDIT